MIYDEKAHAFVCKKCPTGAERCSFDSSGKVKLVICATGYATDYQKHTCIKCPTGSELCGLDESGKIKWIKCPKGYHHPYTKKGYDDTRCVKDGQCTFQNPC